jgi:hypothetical protein
MLYNIVFYTKWLSGKGTGCTWIPLVVYIPVMADYEQDWRQSKGDDGTKGVYRYDKSRAS